VTLTQALGKNIAAQAPCSPTLTQAGVTQAGVVRSCLPAVGFKRRPQLSAPTSDKQLAQLRLGAANRSKLPSRRTTLPRPPHTRSLIKASRKWSRRVCGCGCECGCACAWLWVCVCVLLDWALAPRNGQVSLLQQTFSWIACPQCTCIYTLTNACAQAHA